MIYGTAHDELNGHGQGLQSPMTDQAVFVKNPGMTPGGRYGLLNTPIGSVTSNIPFLNVSAGIDSSNNPFVTVNGTTYFDFTSARNVLSVDSLYGLAFTMYHPSTMADLIGGLRTIDPTIPFTAYVPPPAPAPYIPPPPPTPNITTPTPVTVTPSIPLPPGYQPMPATGAVSVFPIYSQAPVFNADGTTSIGGPAFYSLTAGEMGNSIGLDPTKLSAGLYAYKVSDLGPIRSAANRTYELYMLTIVDLTNQNVIGPFFETTEGGGGGLLIANPLALASRIIVDLSTLGNAELVRAAAKAAGVSQQNIDLATEAGAALAIAIATAGVATAAGAGSGATAVAEGAFPTAVDAGSATATLILPTTAEVAAMDAAGATLLPASLSLIAPAAIPLTVAEAVTAGTTVASEAVAPSSVALPAGVKAAGTGIMKAVEGTIVSTGLTALSTEIKKLTGQLPGAKPPSQLVSAPVSVVAAPAGSPNLLKWGLGAIAALALLKKHSS